MLSSLFEIYLTILIITSTNGSKTWQWVCNETTEFCNKIEANDNLRNVYGNLEVCRLICGKYGALWPKPTLNCSLSKQLITLDPSLISFDVTNAEGEAKDFLLRYTEIFLNNVKAECGRNGCKTFPSVPLYVKVSVTSPSLLHQWNTSEHYSLEVTLSNDQLIANIKADNYYGARHGLETLTQLFAAYDGVLYVNNGAQIVDQPVYPHRGVLLDTARNYLKIEDIKRQIHAMAASKLNILHLHATDSQSFPLALPSVPQLVKYGSYSNKMIYTQKDLKTLTEHAKLHGIRLIIEIDAPSHSGNGWQWGPKENLGELAVCVNKQPWRYYCMQPPCGQLNPANDNVYEVLKKLYGDLVDVQGKEVFHMGGDEIFYPCWNSSQEILKFMSKNGWNTQLDGFLKLWSYYQERALKQFDAVVGDNSTPIILWSNDLTEPENIEKYLDKRRYVVQTWVASTSSLPDQLLNKGYKIILSTKNAWYLDHGFWGNTNYYNWQIVYNNRLIQHNNVLGGEVCMWAELVDGTSIDPKLWPRAAAAAERLWSNPAKDSLQATKRMLRHRERLVIRGIKADALVPKWCYQNEGECY